MQAWYSETLYKQIVPLNKAHILAIDIFDLPLMVLEIIEVK